MTIEIHSPNLKVSEKTLESIKKKLMDLSHLGEYVSRAEIFFTEENSSAKQNKNCRIRLSMLGDTLFVHKTSDSFEKAAAAVIRVLNRRLKQKRYEQNLPPDEITTTVDV